MDSKLNLVETFCYRPNRMNSCNKNINSNESKIYSIHYFVSLFTENFCIIFNNNLKHAKNLISTPGNQVVSCQSSNITTCRYLAKITRSVNPTIWKCSKILKTFSSEKIARICRAADSQDFVADVCEDSLKQGATHRLREGERLGHPVEERVNAARI